MMKIQPSNLTIFSVSKNNIKFNDYHTNNYQLDNYYQRNQINNEVKMVATGILGSMAIITAAGLLSKSNFDKKIAKMGLEIKDNLLINKSTGEKFTGKINSNVGKLGFTKIETQEYIDGVIKERIYKNFYGKELEGYFYKNGKECIKVQVNYPYFIPYNKHVVSYHYNEKHTECRHQDLYGFEKESVFEWARNVVKKFGWFEK